MRAGKLRHKIIIQHTQAIENDFGEDVDTWVEFKSARSQIVPLAGKEYFAASQIKSKVTHKITCRYVVGVTTKMRILFGVRIFDIESAININEKNRELLIMATENV